MSRDDLLASTSRSWKRSRRHQALCASAFVTASPIRSMRWCGFAKTSHFPANKSSAWRAFGFGAVPLFPLEEFKSRSKTSPLSFSAATVMTWCIRALFHRRRNSLPDWSSSLDHAARLDAIIDGPARRRRDRRPLKTGLPSTHRRRRDRHGRVLSQDKRRVFPCAAQLNGNMRQDL